MTKSQVGNLSYISSQSPCIIYTTKIKELWTLEEKHLYLTRLSEYLKLLSLYFYLFIHNEKIEKILQKYKVQKVYDKYYQSPILKRKLIDVR